jgi:adenylate cyclase|tara:strand:+ start:175 stop:1545 length:1371 start_codon:yes stop_codon:yes gene_type:complete
MLQTKEKRVLKLLGGGDAQAKLPDRVRQAIERQEDRTEQLIGWIQLVVVLLFGSLYTISPKTAPMTLSEDLPVQPVPWILGIYFGLTLIRIIWTHQSRLPDGVVALSIVLDVALLMILIWTFHLQYGQPASFYLKAPTLLYIFIFIALRALRFDARFVVLTGVVGALGWGAMLYYVITIDPTNTMITRSYVDYLTSNAVLLGAEFDKIISILVVSIILGVALVRGRDLLVRSVSENLAAQELSRFFAPQVADRIKGADQEITAGSAEICEAAILNLDLRGFTRLAESAPPETVLALLGAYQARCVPIIQKHGGSIDKFLGDGIMATFGAAESSATYAADGLRALEEILDAAEAWKAARAAKGQTCPEINGALATGRILFGTVGDETRLEITVIGDAVNLSAKLEKHNKATGTRGLVTAASFKLGESQGFQSSKRFQELPQQSVSGVRAPVDLLGLR